MKFFNMNKFSVYNISFDCYSPWMVTLNVTFFLFLTIYFCPVCFIFSWFDIFFLENPLEGLYLDVSAWRFTGNNDSIIFI